MTAILRIINVTINSSSSIAISFTENITSNLVPANVSLITETANVPTPSVLLLAVSGNTLTITCQPLTPLAAYFIQLQSTANNPFISVNGDAKISQDGVSNRYLITGPIDPQNPVTNYLGAFYQGSIYDLEDTTNVVSQYLNSIAINFARALYDIRQVKNENYLSFTIIDESQIRGSGPYDRLNEEAAYDVFRVGLSPTQSAASTSMVFSEFPDYPVTLQAQNFIEIIKPSSNNENGIFNIDTLTFNLGNSPITKVNSITFNLTTIHPVYVYNISTLGYQLLSSRYDQQYASSYLTLENNQVKLNGAILQDPNFSLDQILNIVIQYEYKDLGREVNTSTVLPFITLQSIREVLPPIENIFNLQHAPITDASNNAVTLGGVFFTNPNSNTGAPHPAFITEITFSLSGLPSSPGVYAIDYTTGTVYVYGASSTNDGTGPSPPLATYYYKFNYVSEIDYVYDTDLLDLIALPNGNLINQAGTIPFNYEEVLVPGIDYIADTHVESIYEAVNNNVIALNALTTQNSPITNVFQIYNQTSGEIYTLNRWYNNIVYFNYINPPRLLTENGENATFASSTNELLCVQSTTTNVLSQRIFVIYLANNTIISSTQDCIASSLNTSLVFNDGNVFVNEIWYNQEFDAAVNINRLTTVGQYMVDYKNGIVYVNVSALQNNNLGTATYKINNITPDYPHVISVNDIYYRISVLNPKNKQFTYASFSNGSIIPEGLDVSDEGFLNNNITAPYQYYQGNIGVFTGATFIPNVTNAVDFVRSVYEYNDLLNNPYPINFAQASTSNNFTITVNSIVTQYSTDVQYGIDGYFVLLNENVPYISPGISYSFSIIRTSDSAQLWNGSGTIVPGNPLKLILPDINSPIVGDFVNITYSFSIVPLERVIVDYNKGDFYIDYTYVADELLVSYEYGDNVLDFRSNTTVPAGTQYYVSYKVGALRDTLLKNFATLVNVPELTNFDLSLDRERYREALQAALSSFVQGPTIAAIKNIGNIISHIEPEVIESAFNAWYLGSSILTPVSVQTQGEFQLLPAHFSNGVLINQPNQTITMPANSNLRLEEGTFETWILPQWNGLDNNAELTFTININGSTIDGYRAFIGANEYHPTITNGKFTLNKTEVISGLPNRNKDGVFIYYANDPSGAFQRWYVEVIDGYVYPNTNLYNVNIKSNGKFYNNYSIDGYIPPNMTMFTGSNSITFTLTGGMPIDEGITFISDLEYYLLDFGQSANNSRLSIFKDVSGYMNFRVYDNFGTMYSVSSNVSNWKTNEQHMVAASWKLNTRNNRDEMHLFIDGFEVPNIIKYGQRLQPYPHENFRTVDPEDIVGLPNRDIVGSDDLVTIAGSNVVTSTINFSDYNISDGDIITINEIGFSPIGYSILTIDGQTLTLSSPMPISLTNGRYSVNETKYSITSDINVVPNITVSTIHVFTQGSDLQVTDGYNTIYSPSTNFTTLGVLPGYSIRIDNSNFALICTIVKVSGHTLTITDPSPITLTGLTYQIYSNTENELPGVRAVQPDYGISQNSNFEHILTIFNGVFENDLVLVRTLGFNYRYVKEQYYVWSSETENVLKTRLPAPIDLDEARIIRVILPNTLIGSSNSIYSGGEFISNNLPCAQPSNSLNGRTIKATISGTNVDFSSPVQVTINGVAGITTISETISFDNYGTLDFANYYVSVNWIQVTAKPLNSFKNALNIIVEEKFPITQSEFSGLVPVIRYSYYINGGYNLSATGYNNFVTDGYNLFSSADIGNYLLIGSPSSVAGYYIINGISADRHSVSIQPTNVSFSVPLPAFTEGTYQVLNTTDYRSGLQNGFFTLESGELPGTPYLLSTGFYKVEYSTYASIKFNPLNVNMYFGSDFTGSNQVNAIYDQAIIYSIMLTDTRIGETISNRQYSITKDFNSLISEEVNSNMLVLLTFDSFPFTNSAKFYASTNDDHIHFQTDWTVNDNFEQSLVVLDEPIVLANAGILNTLNQGTIEFWMSPIYDTANDPQNRYYFDAYSAIVEEVVSLNNVSVKVSTPASKILSVTLAAGDPTIDYFAGGKLEIDTQNAIQEQHTSIGNSIVQVNLPILQVITVKIVGDVTGVDYFNNGTIGSDQKTIYLGTSLPQNNLTVIVTYQTTANLNTTLNTQVIRLNRRLPAQNSTVIVKYIPKGLQGDRISIFKDQYGFMNFSITASNTSYVVKAPTRWAKNTWHRVKASYQLNGVVGTDEMRLFLDGYQYTDVTFGPGLIAGKFPSTFGAVSIGDGYSVIGNIIFKDPINYIFIGADYTSSNPIFTTLNNFRISNLSRPVYAPYGEPIDVNYSSNLSTVFPVTQDLYTTYLMNSGTDVQLISTFATLINRLYGGFDFTVNIFDSFGIVSSNPQIKQILESLINILKPANSMVYINYE